MKFTPSQDHQKHQKHQQQHQQPFLLVTCGIKHIKFWSHSGNTLSGKKGIFGKAGSIQSMMNLAFKEHDAINSPLITYSVTLAGDVYVWNGSRLSHVVKGIHEVSILPEVARHKLPQFSPSHPLLSPTHSPTSFTHPLTHLFHPPTPLTHPLSPSHL